MKKSENVQKLVSYVRNLLGITPLKMRRLKMFDSISNEDHTHIQTHKHTETMAKNEKRKKLTFEMYWQYIIKVQTVAINGKTLCVYVELFFFLKYFSSNSSFWCHCICIVAIVIGFR